MSQPLGLKPDQERTYVQFLQRAHDFAMDVDILNLDHSHVRTVTGVAIDGQINVQRDAAINRTASFSFDDPDHSLHLDADSPWEGASWGNRLVRVRHTVTVPGVGKVESTPFIGPITAVSRDGDTLSVECQDKAALALTGSSPVKAGKGTDAVAGIRRIMANAAGEQFFRLPSNLNRNLHRAYHTGWKEDASPWVVCQKIAAQLDMQLIYSCDGYLTLRKRPKHPSVYVTGASVTSPPQVDWAADQVSNMVRVAGTQAPPKKKTAAKKAASDKESPVVKLYAVAVAAPNHPLSGQKLGRNGVPRYLPTIIEGAVYKSLAQARSVANTQLSRSLVLTTGVSFDMIPLFHLDYGDLIDVQTPYGHLVVALEEASIPLGIGGDMSVGTQRIVHQSRARNRVHTHRRIIKPKKPHAHKGHHGTR